MSEELVVRRISNGTVIDHIPAGRALKVLKILGITGEEGLMVSLVMNASSKKLGRKDIVKVEGKETIIRHLVLPGHLKCYTEKVLNWISENFPEALVNVMGQYRPEFKVKEEKGKWGSLGKALSFEEYREAIRMAKQYNLILI